MTYLRKLSGQSNQFVLYTVKSSDRMRSVADVPKWHKRNGQINPHAKTKAAQIIAATFSDESSASDWKRNLSQMRILLETVLKRNPFKIERQQKVAYMF